MAKQEAIQAIVTGNDQQVGFRALVMKQAIEYNLAGSAVNDPNQTVHFVLQGDKKRIASALATIRQGTKRSSNLKVTTTSTPVDPALNSFTIMGWTHVAQDIEANAPDGELGDAFAVSFSQIILGHIEGLRL